MQVLKWSNINKYLTLTCWVSKQLLPNMLGYQYIARYLCGLTISYYVLHVYYVETVYEKNIYMLSHSNGCLLIKCIRR